jgi:alkanesulfonate monooxygenase SsuD/methylene tetrahydromethanopterin reductase-like flavin-dependent oxidoreductase (luciferase family)
MKAGINFLPDATWEQMSGQQFLNEALDLAALADELGLSHVKITEHYLGAYGGYSPSPVAFLSAASQRTKQARLITGCVLPVFRHPIHMASELAMLDCMSNGRLEVGFARAWLPKEFEALGVSMDGSRAVFTEHVEAVVRLWTETNVSWQGTLHKFEDVTIYTRPVQQPHPPVWIAVTMTPQSYSWAGRMGYRLMVNLTGWDMLGNLLKLYHNAYQEAGHGTVNPENILVGLPAYVAETTEEALAEAEAPYYRSQAVMLEAGGQWKNAQSDDYRLYHAFLPGLEEKHRHEPASIVKKIQEGKLVAGTPDEVYTQLRTIEERLGIGHVSLFFNFGGLEYSKARQSLLLFGQQVLPRLGQPVTSPDLLQV